MHYAVEAEFLDYISQNNHEEHMEKQKNVGTSGKLLRHLGSTTQNHQNCKQLPCCQLQWCCYCPVQEQTNLC